MIENTDELISQIQRVLPQSKTIKQFKPDEQGAYVCFQWNGREFLVKRTLEAFEIRSQRVYITGASMLMQSALSSKDKHQRVLETCLEIIQQVEGMLQSKRQVEQGVKMLVTIRATISRLAGIKKTAAPKTVTG